jgi:hypothetical protein
MKSVTFVGIVTAALLVAAQATSAQEPPPPLQAQSRYAVKFICGTPPHSAGDPDETQPVVRGSYATAINVHNPSLDRSISFAKKVVIALPGQQPGPVSTFVRAQLAPNNAFEIDCGDIRTIGDKTNLDTDPFLKGFVVIMTPEALDVTAVYTARTRIPNAAGTDFVGGSSMIDVEVIQPVRQTATIP